MSSGETVEYIWRLSESLWREGDYRAARRELRRVEADRSALSANVVVGTSVMLNIIEQGAEDYPAAIRALKETEHLVKVCRCPVLTGKWCNSLAATHRAMRDYEPALPLYEEAVKEFERGKARELAASTRNNIGNLFLSLGQPDYARPYIEQALLDFEDEVSRAQAKATRARLRCALGDFDGAMLDATESADFLISIGETTFAAESLKTVGEIVMAERKVRAKR